MSVQAPLLVVVTGMPASGKSTVAELLADRLSLPLVAKDEIKELLYETVGTGDVAFSGRLGGAAYALVFSTAASILRAGRPVIVEANFFCGSAEHGLAALPRHRAVQIHCAAPLDMLVERYRGRARHPGHNDGVKVDELAARLASGAHDPLDLDGELIQLDTSSPLDGDALVSRVGALL